MKNLLLRNMINKYKGLPVQARAAFWFLICAFLQKGISSITTPIFTRLMTTDEYGQFSVFNTWSGLLAVIITLNLDRSSYTRGLVLYSEDRKEFISSMQGLSFTLTVLSLLIYIPLRNYFNSLLSLTTIQVISMIAIIWLATVFQFWASEQRVVLSYRKLVALTLIVSLVRPSLGILLVNRAKDKVTARILGMVAVDLIAYIGIFIFQIIKGKKFFSFRFWKYAILFNLPLIPHYLSSSVLSGSDRIMISKMVGNSEAGIYNLAYSVSLIMTMFNAALLQTIEPWLYKKIKEKQFEKMSKIAYMAFIIIAGVNIILISIAPEVIRIFAPPEYYQAIWVVPPVAMSVYFTFIYYFFSVFEFYYEKTQYVMVSTMTSALMNIVLNYILIKLCGYQAAGYTTLFCDMLYAAFHYFFMAKICRQQTECKQPYSTKLIILISVAFIVVGFIFMVTYKFTLIRYLLIIIISFAVFLKRKTAINSIKQLTKLKDN